MQPCLQVYFRTVQGPVHAYVAIPGGKTCYLSELKTGKEVIVVDQKGQQRTAIVGRVKIETRPLILVEAKVCVLNWSESNSFITLNQVKFLGFSVTKKCRINTLPTPSQHSTKHSALYLSYVWISPNLAFPPYSRFVLLLCPCKCYCIIFPGEKSSWLDIALSSS
jgi:RNase P/RNase MRP subunit p29